MERDERWDRVERAYDLLTLAEAEYTAAAAVAALEQSHARGEDDAKTMLYSKFLPVVSASRSNF